MTRLLILLLLSGCASQHTQQVVLNPAPNTCQTTEVRPTIFSTAVMGACWNAKGEMVSAEWVSGQPVVNVPIAILGAGASLGSAFILGSKIVKAAKSIPTDFNVNETVSGEVDMSGAVDVSGAITVDGDIDIGDGTITIDQDIIDDGLIGDSFEDQIRDWIDGLGD